VKNPKLTVAGAAIEFPIELASGSWLECNGPSDCAAYGSKGEPLGKVTPRGDWPTLPAGIVPLQFTCAPGDTAQARARVTVFSHGNEL
jgi:hypothetical protein